MAIYRIINGHRYTLSGVLGYTQDNVKHNNLILATGGYGVNPANPFADMDFVKTLFNKQAGTEYLHVVLALDADEKPPIETLQTLFDTYAHSIYIVTGCQVAYAIHGNTANLHCHFIINTVLMADGHKLRDDYALFYTLRNTADTLLFQYGLRPIKCTLNNKNVVG